jgi:hypothetical protein
MGLSYKFSAYALHLVQTLKQYALTRLDLRYCQVSQVHAKAITSLLEARHSNEDVTRDMVGH